MADRVDPFHKIVYVLEGSVVYREISEEADRAAGRGACLAVSAGTRHGLHDSRPATLLVLGLGADLVRADADLGSLWRQVRMAARGGMTAGPEERRRLERCWRQALLEDARERVGRDSALKALAADVLVTLARVEPSKPAYGALDRVAAVAREIEHSFPEPWSLDSAASRAGMSRRRFSALYRDIVGKSFLEKLTELRIAHAARLLKRQDATVLGAMFASGFNDLSHFYRVFREHHGVAPGRWGRMARPAP